MIPEIIKGKTSGDGNFKKLVKSNKAIFHEKWLEIDPFYFTSFLAFRFLKFSGALWNM